MEVVILHTFMYAGFPIAVLGIFRNVVWCGISWSELTPDLSLHCRHMNIILFWYAWSTHSTKLFFLPRASVCSVVLQVWSVADGEGLSCLWGGLRLRHSFATCIGSLTWTILKFSCNNFEPQEVSGRKLFWVEGPEGWIISPSSISRFVC